MPSPRRPVQNLLQKLLMLPLLLLSPADMPAHASTTAAVSTYRIDTRVINESSGLARSQRRSDLLWTLNDSGGDAALYGITTHGHHAVTLQLQGDQVGNIDWEDLSSYRRDGHDYVLIGDMGDNFAFRSSLVFYLIREPRLGHLPARVRNLPVSVQQRYEVIYPDGARDAEALAVDGRENMAYVISKRAERPALYRFSLRPGQTMPITLEKLAEIDIPRAPADYPGNPNSFNWVTAMDFDDALDRAYVGTLTTGYFYDRRPDESWAQALSRPPRAFDLPEFPQIEGGCFGRRQRDTVYISSEQLPARMARLRP